MRVDVLWAQIEASASAGFDVNQITQQMHLSDSASGACLFLTVSMPPLPGYRKAKPRGGSPMQGPIWHTRSKSGEAPSL